MLQKNYYLNLKKFKYNINKYNIRDILYNSKYYIMNKYNINLDRYIDSYSNIY